MIEIKDGRITIRDLSGHVIQHSDMTEAERYAAAVLARNSLLADPSIKAEIENLRDDETPEP